MNEIVKGLISVGDCLKEAALAKFHLKKTMTALEGLKGDDALRESIYAQVAELTELMTPVMSDITRLSGHTLGVEMNDLREAKGQTPKSADSESTPEEDED